MAMRASQNSDPVLKAAQHQKRAGFLVFIQLSASTWRLILQGAQLRADPQIETEIEEVIEALLLASEVHWLEWADEVFSELAAVIRGQEEEHQAAKEYKVAENVQDLPVVLQFSTAQIASIAEEEPSGPHGSSTMYAILVAVVSAGTQ
ncbi:hypothetical protein AcV7_002004 [Taiwanofungus camphoratus]|nr:hypothetical protein AcV7_002004 [Antrodia cinnamomea]